MILYLFLLNFFIFHEQTKFDLKFKISNIKYSGKMYFALYDNPDDFNSKNESIENMKLVIREIVNPNVHELDLKVENGNYAVKIFISCC